MGSRVSPSRSHVLVVRLDGMQGVLVCGPAIRAVAAGARRVSMLAGAAGGPTARILPGVNGVVEWECPWTSSDAAPVDRVAVQFLLRTLVDAGIDEAVILTSFRQTPLPTALLLRLAGVRRVSAVSDDDPGSLLD